MTIDVPGASPGELMPDEAADDNPSAVVTTSQIVQTWGRRSSRPRVLSELHQQQQEP